jgi:5-methylcytosine-specific restriction endonuclease McrA
MSLRCEKPACSKPRAWPPAPAHISIDVNTSPSKYDVPSSGTSPPLDSGRSPLDRRAVRFRSVARSRLPKPGSKQLDSLLRGKPESVRAIYRLLYEHRDEPMTMLEIRRRLGAEVGEQEQLDRRRRDLNGSFVIEKSGTGKETRYRLVGMKERPLAERLISEKDRAEVLRSQRCAMCGRTPLGDGVRLQVDHKIPLDLGGTNAIENLQPLCEECNRGKKNLFADYTEYAPLIKKAIGYDEPHKRIGELLKAFGGNWVRSDLLEMVAQAQQYQEDWQKRMRELRTLGWTIEYKRGHEGSRVRTYYRATHVEPWPKGPIRAAIRRSELKKKGKAS